jgi:hypothetical protein
MAIRSLIPDSEGPGHPLSNGPHEDCRAHRQSFFQRLGGKELFTWNGLLSLLHIESTASFVTFILSEHPLEQEIRAL